MVVDQSGNGSQYFPEKNRVDTVNLPQFDGKGDLEKGTDSEVSPRIRQ